MSQLALDLPSATRCGYCNRALIAGGTVKGQTYFECPRCAPELRMVVTYGDYDFFCRMARKDRVEA